MNKIKHERSYRDTAPIKGVVCRHRSADTKIIRTVGMIGMNCDNCGIRYETHACWAKRSNNHFCSKSCHDEYRTVEIKKECVVCGEPFITTPSGWFKHVTCSRKCLRKQRCILLLEQVKQMDSSKFFNYGNHERGSEISGKLTEVDVKKILEDTRPQSVIAKDYGIAQGTVSIIKTKKTWNHVK